MREAKRLIEVRLEPLDERIKAGDKEVRAEWDLGCDGGRRGDRRWRGDRGWRGDGDTIQPIDKLG